MILTYDKIPVFQSNNEKRRGLTMVLISLLLSFMMVSPLAAMCESEDFYDEQATEIVSVPVERFRGYAAALSDAIYEDQPKENRVDLEGLQISKFYEDFMEEVDEESEYEQECILKERREIFIASERDIFQSTLFFFKR